MQGIDKDEQRNREIYLGPRGFSRLEVPVKKI